MIYVVDSDQVTKLHVLKTAPNSYIQSPPLWYSFGFNQGLLTAGTVGYSSSSFDIVQDPTRVSRTVCVWLNVSTTPRNRGIYVQKWLFTGCWSVLNIGLEAGRAVPYKGVDAFCFCNLIWEGVPQARAIRAGMPKSARMVRGTGHCRSFCLQVPV